MENESNNKVSETKEIPQPQQAVETKESGEEINWKSFREKRAEERKATEAAVANEAKAKQEAAALKAAMEALLSKPTSNSSERNESTEDLSEDERLDRLVEAKIAQREKANAAARMEQEEKESLPKAMKAYSDFEKVYTQENCDYLEYHHPELFHSLKKEGDSFEKWSRVYNALKRYVPNTDSRKDSKKAETNSRKPQSMAAPGGTPMGDSAPIKFDDQRRADNWARMKKTMRGGA